MTKTTRLVSTLAMLAGLSATSTAFGQAAEISCTIRDTGGSLNCQWLGKERKVMNADEISSFIDAGNVAAYMTVKSRKGLERTFKVDSASPQYKRYNDMKKSGSISEVNAAKATLFAEIEKKAIKLSDELDGQAAAAELLQYDQAVALEKVRRESRTLTTELEGFRKQRDQACTSTPAFERISKSNSGLQQTLSDLIFAFQTPGTCLSDFKVYKDADGAVDLRQLSSLTEKYKNSCKK